MEAIAPRQVEVNEDSDTDDDEYEVKASQLANTPEMTDDDCKRSENETPPRNRAQ